MEDGLILEIILENKFRRKEEKSPSKTCDLFC